MVYSSQINSHELSEKRQREKEGRERAREIEIDRERGGREGESREKKKDWRSEKGRKFILNGK